MCTLNLNSLCNKLSSLNNLLRKYNISVASVCETWLVSTTPTSFVDIPGYQFYRGDVRGSIRKHGVGIYISSLLSVVPSPVPIPNVCVVYIPIWFPK